MCVLGCFGARLQVVRLLRVAQPLASEKKHFGGVTDLFYCFHFRLLQLTLGGLILPATPARVFLVVLKIGVTSPGLYRSKSLR